MATGRLAKAETARSAHPSDRIFGTGEMAELMRATDWAATPLGPLEHWCESLLSAVNLILASPTPLAVYWGPRLVLIYNDGFREFTGSRHPKCLGLPARQVWPEAWSILGVQFHAAFEEGTPTRHENALVPLERYGILEDHFFTYSFSPVRDRDGIGGVFVVCLETTEAVIAERALRQSEAKALRILESIGDAVIVTDQEARITRMNPVAVELTGWSDAEARGRPLTQVFHIVDEITGQPVESPAAKVKRLGTAVAMDNHTVLLRKDGLEVAIEDSGAPVRDDAGRLTGMVLVFRDVGEKRAAERTLRDSEEQTRFALSAAELGVWTHDFRTGLSSRNRRHEEIYGYQASLPSWSFEQFLEHVVEWDRARIAAEFRQVTSTGSDWEYETEIIRRDDGARRAIWVKARHMRNADGIPIQLTGLVADITERKLAEAAMRTSEERFRALFDLAPVGVCFTDVATEQVLLTNAEMARITGYTREEMATMRSRDFTHPDDRDGIDGLYRRVADSTEAATVIEKRYLRKDGEAIWVRITLRVTPSTDGEATRMLGAVQDITTSRQAQTALVQTEKLAAVGRLAASIAHEINNPLEAVTNLLYLAKRTTDWDGLREYLDTAEQELHRVAAIASQTLRFHRQSTSPKAVSCEDLLSSVLTIYGGKIHNAEVHLEKRLHATRPVICLDGEIRQVLSNLIGNAVDAMAGTGRGDASSRRLLLRSREATDWTTGRRGLILTVADNGKGMTPHTLRRLFEAFYTTKGNNGTGLGLWVSHEIVVRHDGALRVRSSQRIGASGTVFTLFLPFEAAIRNDPPAAD